MKIEFDPAKSKKNELERDLPFESVAEFDKLRIPRVYAWYLFAMGVPGGETRFSPWSRARIYFARSEIKQGNKIPRVYPW